jgi:hypothetical protein
MSKQHSLSLEEDTLPSNNIEAKVRERRMTKKRPLENWLSPPETSAIYVEGQLYFHLRNLFRSHLGVWQRNETHESAETI